MVVAANFLVPNATFVVELVSFLVVLGVLAKYVLPAVNTSMSERQGTIRKALEDAERARVRSEEAEAEYHRMINEARQESRTMLEEANKAGEALRAELRQKGEAEYERITSRASADIDASMRRASEELRQQVSEMVVLVVRKVVGDALDVKAHRELIDRMIDELEREAHASPGVTA